MILYCGLYFLLIDLDALTSIFYNKLNNLNNDILTSNNYTHL